MELVASLLAVIASKPGLSRDPHAISMHAVGLLVPFVAAVLFAVLTLLKNRRLHGRAVAAAVALFVFCALPFADVLQNPIVHLQGDDSFRYSTYAHHILAERTLWGSDGLLHDARYFVDQPGFRYYLAAVIGLLGGEHRGLQLFNMAILLAAILWLLRSLALHLPDRYWTAVAIFVLASAPYAGKNIIFGNTEWFAVAVSMAATTLLLSRRYAAAVVFLALMPFVRQNLLVISLLMAGFTLAQSRRWSLGLLYVAILLLPLYHNLYYAAEWRFFVVNTGQLVKWTGNLSSDARLLAEVITSKLVGYLGYCRGEKLTTMLIAVFFAPLGTVFVAWWFVDRPAERSWLALAVVATVTPTLFFGSLGFPRFEFVNLTVVLLSFAVLTASGSGAVKGD